MSVTLRVILIVISVVNFFAVMARIRKSQTVIEDMLFWFFFSAILVVMSIFPSLIYWGAAITGVESPSNFVFLCIIFILILKVFTLSVKLSQLTSRLQNLAQRYAIDMMEPVADESKHDEETVVCN